MHQHTPRFLKIVEDAKKRVRETTVDDVKARMDRREHFILVDVARGERVRHRIICPALFTWAKGSLERDIEQRVPDTNAPLILYCGGGFRMAPWPPIICKKWATRT